MRPQDVCVVIPLYKADPDPDDVVSLEQCTSVLSAYDHVIVTHAGLDLTRYKTLCPTARIVYFEESFFSSIDGYNRLMLSQEFYTTFAEYQYILIHQTDAFVFRDELLSWCLRGFDYVGGVWVDQGPSGTILGGKCGNGGLSLRKVSTFVSVTAPGYRVAGWRDLCRTHLHYRERGLLYRVWYALTYLPKVLGLVLPRSLGYKNTFRYVCRTNPIGEDRIFVHLVLSKRNWQVPDLQEGWGFSWELRLEALWSQYATLPFGCHAWPRQNYFDEPVRDFWKKHIPTP